MRAIFMGSDPIALPLLEAIWVTADIELVGVFTQPDRQRGRGHKVQVGPIKAWAVEHELPVRQPPRCGTEDEDWLVDQRVDVLVVMAYGQILRRRLLSLPPLGTWNFHASILPYYRGASPIATAIAQGEARTGVSLMQIVPKLDAGPVLDHEAVAIGPQDTAVHVATALGQACVSLWHRGWTKIQQQVAPVPQNDAAATYCRILTKDDAALDFAHAAEHLYDRVRAFQPWPGARVKLGDDILKVGETAIVDRFASPPPGVSPGHVMAIDSEGAPVIQCGRGHLRVLRLQRPGGRMLPAREFRRGYRLEVGDVFQSEPMRILCGPKPFRRAEFPPFARPESA